MPRRARLDPRRDQLDAAGVVAEPEALHVRRLKRLADLRRRAVVGQLDRQLVRLPLIAQVRRVLDPHILAVAVRPNRIRHLLAQRGVDARQRRAIGLARGGNRQMRALLRVARHVRAQHPAGAEHSGRGWNERRRNAQRVGQIAGVQRPRAAERDQREARRIVPALDRNHPQRPRHIRVHHVDHRRRRAPRIAPERLRHAAQRPLCPRRIQRNRPAQPLLGAQTPQHRVRVGHRRRLPAPVGGRPRIRARALRSHPQRAARVEPRNRAAARAHRVQVHRRRANRHPVDHQVRALQ